MEASSTGKQSIILLSYPLGRKFLVTQKLPRMYFRDYLFGNFKNFSLRKSISC